ncbi:unnamed protein product [Fusarium graminearum]|uniref:L-asparaginase N-terminal domain-containing protein n=1 Tax=Gibberella zeae TaxID=5518 RepID=A0A9N8RN26_GIBZA|nr:unnamed protein product [Fusarium graminearum]
MEKTTVLIMGTGGTIAGIGTKNNYKSGTLGLEKVLEPVGYDKDSITLKLEQISEGDGVDKSSGFIVQLAYYIVRRTAYFKKCCPAITAIVALVGSDAIAELMSALNCLPEPGITVAVTGAADPATDPNADGPGNISDAIKVVVHPEALGRGPMLVFNHKIMCGPSIRKKDVQSKDAFESGPGPVGHIDDGHVSFSVPVSGRPPHIIEKVDMSNVLRLPPVGTEFITHDYDPERMNSLIKHTGIKAFIFITMGNGYSNQAREGIREILKDHDMIAVLCTATGQPLVKSNAGFGIPGGYLSVRTIEIILKICLLAKKDRGEIERIIHGRGQVELLRQTDVASSSVA